MTTKSLLTTLTIILTTCAFTTVDNFVSDNICITQSLPDNPISIDKLLENCKIYNEQTVTVTGFYVDDFENRSLNSSKKIAKKHQLNPESNLLKSSIWISSFSKDIKLIDKKGKETTSIRNSFVIITGKFICKYDTIYGKIYGHGHMNLWPAELTEITKMKESN